MQKLLFVWLLFLCVDGEGQLWRSYADSAKIFQKDGKLNEAIAYYSSSIEALQKDSAECETVGLLSYNLGRIYLDQRIFDNAETCLTESAEIRQRIFGRISSAFAESWNGLGTVSYYRGEYATVEKYWLEVKSIQQTLFGKESLEYAKACYNLGLLYGTMGQYKEAESYYVITKRIRQKKAGEKSNEYAIVCNALAALYQQMGQYEKAKVLYEESKDIKEKLLGKEHIEYAIICNNLAGIYKDLGDYDSAELLGLEAMQIIESTAGKEDLEYARCCNMLGIIYIESGQYKKVEKLYIEARRIWGKVYGKESIYYAISSNNLGNFYMQTGQYEQAELSHITAKEIREKQFGKNHPDYALSCNNLANLYSELGQYKKAEALFLEAKEIREKLVGKENTDYAHSCSNLADLYSKTGEFEKAEQLYKEAMLIRKTVLGKNHDQYAESCSNLSNLYTNTGQYEKAEQLQLEAIMIREKLFGKNNATYANSCNNLGMLYSYMHQYEKAEKYLLESEKLIAEIFGRVHSAYAGSCLNLADLYRNTGSFDKAKVYYEKTFTSYTDLVAGIFTFTSEKEKLIYLKEVANLETHFFSFDKSFSAMLKGGFSYNVALNNRNMVLSSLSGLRQSIYNSDDTIIKNKYDEWISLREQLSLWLTEPLITRKEMVTKLEEKAEKAEKYLNSYSTEFQRQHEVKSKWQTIQQSLKPGEAAIEFVEFEYYNGKELTDTVYYMAYLLTQNLREPELITLFSKKQLDSILPKAGAGEVYVNYLYTPKKESQKQSLYELIWKPLEQKLTGITTVYFAPAGLLHKIAFTALSVNGTEVLSDKYQLVQLNTTASVVDKLINSVSVSDKIILYGGVQYDADSTSIRQAALQFSANDVATRSLPDDLARDGIADFYYLSGTEKEVNAISKLADQNNYTITLSEGLKATEESFKSLNGKNSPEVLHIATHGFFFPDPKNKAKDEKTGGAIVFKQSDNPLIRSGLAMAGANNAWKGKAVAGVEDGILTSYEVSNMYLPNTKLVVLSACETGLGDIQGSEGVYGLQRAFKMAGVENLVMSLWKVDDIATSEFMEEFYKNLFEKQTINSAFYKAQTVMKNKYRNDPYKWAAWILIR